MLLIFPIVLISLIASVASQNCPNGEGYYCGTSVAKDAMNLYICTELNGWQISEVCQFGCEENLPGFPDHCFQPVSPSGYEEPPQVTSAPNGTETEGVNASMEESVVAETPQPNTIESTL
ncbi:hypothetical protein CLU79DRAFT_725670 [Phycomyces nitens]|nr:hypothetical protein CLU79DRAFT_725670 [Phycomyces nitens]